MQAFPATIKDLPVDDYGRSYRSIEVEINGDRRAIRCGSEWRGRVTIYDLACRFPTGAKVWPASADVELATGRVFDIRPAIDKRTANRCSLAGYLADFEGKAAESRHVGA